MKINKYFLFAFIYFFINSVGLPFGLTYTAILSPLLYWWVKTSRKEVLLPFLAGISPFIIVHFIQVVDTRTYVISVINYTAVYIFCQAFYTFLQKCKDPEKIFRKLMVANFLFCLIAIPVYFTSYNPLLWMQQSLTNGTDNSTRLKLFTYEASYYGVIFIPLFFFFLLQLISYQNKIKSRLLLAMLFLPLVLSFSIGVLAALICAIAVTGGMYFKTFVRNKRAVSLLAIFLGGLITGCIILLVFYPHNVIFIRIADVLSGKDVSGKGRTFDAFILAEQILQQKNSIWGVGPGQIKLLGAAIIRGYYFYPLDYNGVAIPNAAAETLAIFGWAGLWLRIITELFFFLYTRVWKNYFQLLLFVFIFLYQFTGSFITNIAEYVIWILTFTNAFPAFNARRKSVVYNTVHQILPA